MTKIYLKLFNFLLIGILLNFQSIANTNIFPYNSSWKYFDQGIEPLDSLNLRWYEAGYPDQSWQVGAGQFGYGDGDEATVINDSTYTAYFRKVFTVNDPSEFNVINVELTYDDGAILYLNGVELDRINMPLGPVTYSTFSAAASGENAVISKEYAVNLNAGINIIAVEVHQRSATSSDISFDLNLSGSDNSTPGITNVFPFESQWKYYTFNSSPNVLNGLNWKENNYDDSLWSDGIGQIGYGDGDENTVVPDTLRTMYFRKSFNIPDTTGIVSLDYTLLYDDGAIVYLNGQELNRYLMPADPISHATLATGGIENAQVSAMNLVQLNQGDNTLAVQLHQRSLTSSDLSFDLELFTNQNQIVSQIIRGPYLQKATDNSIVIKYRTNIPMASKIIYGTDSTNLGNIQVDSIARTDHTIEIFNLLADTKYFYTIESLNENIYPAASDVYFKSNPTVGTDKVFITADMMLFLGDNAYTHGTDIEYQAAIFENMYEDKLKNTTAWSCIGNHEGLSANSINQTGPYYDIFNFPKNGESGGIASGTEAYYSFDYGKVHFIILDSHQNSRAIGGPMYNWTMMDLQNTLADWIIVLFHHPPYSKGSHNSDSELQLVEMRQNFNPLLESYGVDLILSGHSHAYERSKYINGHYGLSNTFDSLTHIVGINGAGDGNVNSDGCYYDALSGNEQELGTIYAVTGSAGRVSGGALNHPAMHYSVSHLGSSILRINEDTLELKFLRETGVIEDEFHIVKSNCTIGDTCNYVSNCDFGLFDENCICILQDQDADNDSIPDICDPCNNLLNGTYCDNGDPCTSGDYYDTNCNCIPGQIVDVDNDGICSIYDLDDLNPNINQYGPICNDNDPCTLNDFLDGNNFCSGIYSDLNNDSICDFYDCLAGINLANCPTNCNDTILINFVNISSGMYKAARYIESNATINNYGTVIYQANDLIFISSDFSTLSNVFFEARIDTCY